MCIDELKFGDEESTIFKLLVCAKYGQIHLCVWSKSVRVRDWVEWRL